jgi:Rho GDP-dissociation inhibitor
VILLSLGLEVEGRSDIIIDLTQTGALESLNKKPFTIKEGAVFRMKARFRVQHEILSGMKYVQVVSRLGVKQKMQEMIVSFLSPRFSLPLCLSLSFIFYLCMCAFVSQADPT